MERGKILKGYMFLGIICNFIFYIVLDFFHFKKGQANYYESNIIKYLLLVIGSSIIILLIWRTIRAIEKGLKEERDYFSSISNTVEAYIITLDKYGKIHQVNDYCLKESGYSFVEIQGKHVWDIFLNEEDKNYFIDVFKGKKLPKHHANFWILKDGSQKYIQWANTVVENNNGEIEYIIGAGIDITERRKMEEKLKRSKESYEHLVEYHPDPILAFTNEKIFFYNYTSMDLLETTEGLVGKNIYDYIHPDYKDFVSNRIDLLLKNKIEFIDLGDFDVITEKGNIKKVEGIGISNFIWGREVAQFVIRDVTERKRTEELLQKSEKLAVIGQLAAGVAHEIRNPLTSIHGFLKVIQSQTESSQIKDYIDITLSEVNRINAVTNELLFLAKPQEEKIEIIDMGTLLKDVINFMDSEANLKDIIINYNETEAELSVQGIVNHLKQVLLNIFKNSFDAMPSGGEIQVIMEEHQGIVHVEVTDQGVGIPEERLKHIGEPFYSLKENGTGLGLMITKKIIKEHHGIFEIDSQKGRGTTVKIKLPLARIEKEIEI